MRDTFIVDWVTFKGTSPRGARRRGSLEQFVSLVTTRNTAWLKELSPGFSATRYRDEYTHIPSSGRPFLVQAPSVWRSNPGVDTLSALVADIDHDLPDWPRLRASGNLIVAYTSWSNAPGDPHWRIVVPFAAPVAAECWPSAWQLGLERFDPHADPGCKDVSHLYWLPSAPPLDLGRIEVRVIDGEPWAPDGLVAAPPASASFALHPVSDAAATSEEQAAARRILASTCAKLAQHAEGGRQVAAYGHGRMVGHLVAANAVSEEDALAALEQAVSANGVLGEREAEVRRAIATGLARGVADGAFDFATDQRRPTRLEIRALVHSA